MSSILDDSDAKSSSTNIKYGGKRYYLCDMCNATFILKSDLKKHLNEYRPNRCDVCHIYFTEKCLIEKHVKPC